MEQNELFPAARRTNPGTSKRASQEITESGERQRQVDIVAKALRKWDGRTARELATLARLDFEMVHKRLSDAKRLGLVTCSGERHCAVTGKMAVLWWFHAE